MACPIPARAGDVPRASPFTAVAWTGDVATVEVGGRSYTLVAIDDTKAADIVAYCHEQYGKDWGKRFEEDLVEVLIGMGKTPGATVSLDVRESAAGTITRLDSVPMTKENRTKLRDARRGREGKHDVPDGRVTAPPRVSRDHARKPSAAFDALLNRHDSGPELTATAVGEDLDQLEWLVEHRFSYATRLGVDTRAVLDEIRTRVGDGISRGAFAIQLQKVLALYGDGHSGVDAFERHLPDGFAPFLVERTERGIVAFKPDRTGLLDDARPYVRRIDGIPVERWVEVASRTVAKGAPHLVAHRTMRALRFVAYLRAELSLPPKPTIELELAAADGKSPSTIAVALAARKPAYGAWPRSRSRVLDGNIGYLRIASMDEDPAFLDDLFAAMTSVLRTKGLVIDVRGNGGGSRRPLHVLFPCFQRPGEASRVVNVGAIRLGPGERPDLAEGYLANRFSYPAAWGGWSVASRAAIATVAAAFQPEWPLPVPGFSAWHYLVLERAPEAKSPSYDKPVVVLLDSGCFSATDIFLSAFQGHRNVTLLGTPSGGGSGRKDTHVLLNSALGVELSTMASFRSDGRLYDGRGVEPDVVMEPSPLDFVGRTDTVLDAAVQRLR